MDGIEATETGFASGRILAEVADGVGLLTFNQPGRRNAMSVAMWDGLGQVLEAWEADDEVRVVVLTGAGDKAFVSGADISEFGERRSDAEARKSYDWATGAGRVRLAAFPKPVIARIRGFCLGGGVDIATLADLRVASDDSTFGIPAARLGIAYGFDLMRRLAALVGEAEARLLLFTGGRIGAAEALRIRLVNRIVPAGELVEHVAGLARTIAGNAPLSVRGMKLILNQIGRDPTDRDMDGVRAAVATCFGSADYIEGRTAFMEKRPPAFRGR